MLKKNEFIQVHTIVFVMLLGLYDSYATILLLRYSQLHFKVRNKKQKYPNEQTPSEGKLGGSVVGAAGTGAEVETVLGATLLEGAALPGVAMDGGELMGELGASEASAIIEEGITEGYSEVGGEGGEGAELSMSEGATDGESLVGIGAPTRPKVCTLKGPTKLTRPAFTT